MSLHYWLLVLVGGSCGLYLGIALRARARTTAEFYLADRGVGPIANGMATAPALKRRSAMKCKCPLRSLSPSVRTLN